MAKKKSPEEPTYIQRLYKARQLADEGIAPTDPDFQAAYPTLFELLTDGDLGEGKRTEVASIRIVNAAGDWHFTLTSPGMGGFCEVAVSCVKDGLQALEERARKGPGAWMFWRKSKVKIQENGKAKEST